MINYKSVSTPAIREFVKTSSDLAQILDKLKVKGVQLADDNSINGIKIKIDGKDDIIKIIGSMDSASSIESDNYIAMLKYKNNIYALVVKLKPIYKSYGLRFGGDETDILTKIRKYIIKNGVDLVSMPFVNHASILTNLSVPYRNKKIQLLKNRRKFVNMFVSDIDKLAKKVSKVEDSELQSILGHHIAGINYVIESVNDIEITNKTGVIISMLMTGNAIRIWEHIKNENVNTVLSQLLTQIGFGLLVLRRVFNCIHFDVALRNILFTALDGLFFYKYIIDDKSYIIAINHIFTLWDFGMSVQLNNMSKRTKQLLRKRLEIFYSHNFPDIIVSIDNINFDNKLILEKLKYIDEWMFLRSLKTVLLGTGKLKIVNDTLRSIIDSSIINAEKNITYGLFDNSEPSGGVLDLFSEKYQHIFEQNLLYTKNFSVIRMKTIP